MNALLNERQLWQKIISDAQLGEEVEYLSFLRPEFKRSTLFLRQITPVEMPESALEKVRLAAAALDFQLHLTGKWATMNDLRFAVGDVAWLWKDWIPLEMITLLAGEPGTGKSTLALWFCKLVAEGIPFPGASRTSPNRVIFVDAEAAQVITKERCIAMGLPLDRVYVPNLGNDMLAQPDLNDETHRAQLWNMVEEVRPSLIVIDSMGGIKSGGENKKEEMQPIMLYLTRLVQNRDSAIMVLHHLNKTKREESEEITLNHLRGSTTIAQFARSVMFLAKKPQGVKLWVGKSNLAKLTDGLVVLPRIEYVEGTSVIRGFDFDPWQEDVKRTKLEECEDWILRYLASGDLHSGIAARQIFEAGDETWTTRTVKDAGAVLERKGLIRRTGGKNSVWSLFQLRMPYESNGHERSEGELPESEAETD